MAPITVIETVENTPQGLRVSGVTFDDRGPVQVDVNGQELTVDENGPVANWTTLLPQGTSKISAGGRDDAGNRERTPHVRMLESVSITRSKMPEHAHAVSAEE
ncbi:MAG: hypothetical protein AAGI63_00490 [Planctomycetota bacterium]